MPKRFMLIGLAVLLAVVSSAEFGFINVSVTATSQTVTLPAPRDVVSLCNYGADNAYYRLFWDGEVPAAATTAHHLLPSGSATAPFCVGVGRSQTQPASWAAVSIVCDTGDTATVHLEFE